MASWSGLEPAPAPPPAASQPPARSALSRPTEAAIRSHPSGVCDAADRMQPRDPTGAGARIPGTGQNRSFVLETPPTTGVPRPGHKNLIESGRGRLARVGLGGASSRHARRGLVGGHDVRLAPAVERLEAVIRVTQVVGQLDHLEAKAARAEALRGQHHERLDDHSPAGPVQPCSRDHQQLKNASLCPSIGMRCLRLRNPLSTIESRGLGGPRHDG